MNLGSVKFFSDVVATSPGWIITSATHILFVIEMSKPANHNKTKGSRYLGQEKLKPMISSCAAQTSVNPFTVLEDVYDCMRKCVRIDHQKWKGEGT